MIYAICASVLVAFAFVGLAWLKGKTAGKNENLEKVSAIQERQIDISVRPDVSDSNVIKLMHNDKL